MIGSTMGSPIPIDGYTLRLRFRYFEHETRANGLERAGVNGIVERSRRRERPKTSWKDEIKEALGMATTKL